MGLIDLTTGWALEIGREARYLQLAIVQMALSGGFDALPEENRVLFQVQIGESVDWRPVTFKHLSAYASNENEMLRAILRLVATARFRIHERAALQFATSSKLMPPSWWTDRPSTEPRPRGRTRGTGYQAQDKLIAKRMIEMVGRLEAKSPTEAAWSIVGTDGNGAIGIGSPESKVERLVRAAKKLR